jgi:hypothetical protein
LSDYRKKQSRNVAINTYSKVSASTVAEWRKLDRGSEKEALEMPKDGFRPTTDEEKALVAATDANAMIDAAGNFMTIYSLYFQKW